MSKRIRKKNALLRHDLETHYFDVYKQIGMSLFQWENLPEGVPHDFIERKLFEKGSVLFVKDDNLGFYIADYTEHNYNIYDEAQTFRTLTPHMVNFQKEYDRDNVVVIKNNATKKATRQMIKKNIEELVEIDITKNFNTVWQRLPMVFKSSDKTKQSYKSVIENSIDGITPIMVGDNSLDFGGIDVLQTPTQYLGGELREEYKMVVGELLTTLGINNLDIMKKERMITHEVEVNGQEVSINLNKFLDYRIRAVEEINEKFGLNIVVKVNEALFNEEVEFYENDNVERLDSQE